MAKVTRLPVKRQPPPGALSLRELDQLNKARDLIRELRQKCDKAGALDAHLENAAFALLSAIAIGAEMLDGELP